MSSLATQLAYGEVILRRFGERENLPAAVKKALADFANTHARAKTASEVAEARSVEAARVHASAKKADAALDLGVGQLAALMVGEGMTLHTKPFAGFSKYSPARLCALPFTTEAREVRALCDAVLASNPPTKVKRAAQTCLKCVQAVADALADLSAPTQQANEARVARDVLAPELQKVLTALRAHARAAWINEPGVYQSMFALPERVQRAKRSPAVAAKKKTAKDDPGAATE